MKQRYLLEYYCDVQPYVRHGNSNGYKHLENAKKAVNRLAVKYSRDFTGARIYDTDTTDERTCAAKCVYKVVGLP